MAHYFEVKETFLPRNGDQEVLAESNNTH